MKKMTLYSLLIFLLTIAGCSTCTTCGSLRRTGSVDKMVRNGEVIGEYSYYMYMRGSGTPEAIIGLHERYTVEGDFWKEVAMTSDQLLSWSRLWEIDRYTYDDINYMSVNYRGSNIQNPEGDVVGMYYSKYDWTIFNFLENNVVTVSRPQPAPSQKNPGREWR